MNAAVVSCCQVTVPIELAGHCPGWPAAPDGPGLPGRCRGPVRPTGLGASWLPGVSWGGALPLCGPGCRGCPGPCGGWPCCLLRGGTVPCRAAPGPVAESTSPGHERCRVVAGRLRVVLPQRGEPVLGPPPGGIGGIDNDHRQPGVGGHLGQPVPELASGDAGDQPPEGPAAPAARGAAAVALASLGAGGGEVEVLDHDGAGTVLPRGGDEGGNGGPQPPVAGGGGPPGQVQADSGRAAEDVAVGRDGGHGEVAVVDVHRQHRGLPQVVQRRSGDGRGLP